jgi:hypothetical protein
MNALKLFPIMLLKKIKNLDSKEPAIT